MNPGIVLSIGLFGVIIGSLGYAYHQGRQQGKNICNNVILAAQLSAKQLEIKNIIALSEFRNKLVGEARQQIEQERIKSEKLQKTIDSFPSDDQYECVPDSVLSELRKLRGSN